MKRCILLLMACILALSMPVAAAKTSITRISALYKEPKIDVSIPTSGTLLFNPYRLRLNVNGAVSDAQIVSTPWSIKNQSEVAVCVDVEAYANINGRSDMYLSTDSQKDSTSNGKGAFMFLDMKVIDPDEDANDLNWNATVYDEAKQLVITESGLMRENVMILNAADEQGRPTDGGVGAFHIGGDCTANPYEPWNPATDFVQVRITFTFRPTVAPAA